jgi:hypothetical protein
MEGGKQMKKLILDISKTGNDNILITKYEGKPGLLKKPEQTILTFKNLEELGEWLEKEIGGL